MPRRGLADGISTTSTVVMVGKRSFTNLKTTQSFRREKRGLAAFLII